MDLFKNPAGSRTNPAKCLAFCCFLVVLLVVVQKLQFLNHSNAVKAKVREVLVQSSQFSESNSENQGTTGFVYVARGKNPVRLS
jgi:hypothetical protein